jgi:UDP-glucose 4-epimerase
MSPSTSKVLQENRTEALIHFAAASLVAESVADPLKYYRRNVGGSAALLRAIVEEHPTLTRDGTCVRDYVHVLDLCDAHLRALECLALGARYDCFNLGNGEGATVLEVIEAARRMTGREITINNAAKHLGDPASLVADAAEARRVLGWRPQRADIETIVSDAWALEKHRAG